MTTLHVYTLYDGTIETHVAQYWNTHDKLMKRQCEALFEQSKIAHSQNPLSPQGALYRYADSYRLMYVADFDDQTGIYTQKDIPVTICNFGIFNSNENNPTTTMTEDEKVYSELISS